MKKWMVVVMLLMVLCTTSFAGLGNDKGYSLVFPQHPYGLSWSDNMMPVNRQCMTAYQELLNLERWILSGGYRFGDPINMGYLGLSFAITGRLSVFGQMGSWDPEVGDGDTTVQSGLQLKLGTCYGWDLDLSGAYGTTSSGPVDLSGLSGELNGTHGLDMVPGLKMTAGLNMTRYAWELGSMDDSGIEFNFYGGLIYDTPIPGLKASGTAGIHGEEPAVTLGGSWMKSF